MVQIKPLTRDESRMTRDGYFEPERAFGAPPHGIMDGDLDDRAFEMLQLSVWVFRISSHDAVNKGISWATFQRWYSVGSSREMRNRIYSALAFLVHEGYLREGTPTQVPAHVTLKSDNYFPTEKAMGVVDRMQAHWLKKAWLEIADRQGGLAAIVAAVVSATVSLIFQAVS